MREIVKKYLETKDPKILKQLRTEEINYINRPGKDLKVQPRKMDLKKIKLKEDE